MKRNILKFICGIGLVCGLWSCENGSQSFADYEKGTTVYFPYQYPIRTIVLGDDEYDLQDLDWAHKCQIKATFGGSYNGSNGSVTVAVDESLCNNLFFEDGVTPVKAMPSSYYTLSTTNLDFNGTMNGTTVVQLTDAFFSDPDAVKETYVIPLVITSQKGFGQILTGTLLNEDQKGSRTNSDLWDIKPMDYVLYCVKFQNKYSGFWLTNGTTSTPDVVRKDPQTVPEVEVKTLSLNACSYHVSYQDGSQLLEADLKLEFDASNNCKISSLTSGVTATGTGSWGDNTEVKSWGNKDRDGMELNYSVTFANGKTFSTNEKMVWKRSGVKVAEFAPVYVK
jgi:hypothetical protein